MENEGHRIKASLLELGKVHSGKIEDDKFYEDLISDIDFKNRSALKIIVEEKFEPLMDEDDPKPENLMLGIWHGKEATRCYGITEGYSAITHILKSTPK